MFNFNHFRHVDDCPSKNISKTFQWLFIHDILIIIYRARHKNRFPFVKFYCVMFRTVWMSLLFPNFDLVVCFITSQYTVKVGKIMIQIDYLKYTSDRVRKNQIVQKNGALCGNCMGFWMTFTAKLMVYQYAQITPKSASKSAQFQVL